MEKLNIKKVEEKLGKTIRQNAISVGIDVAENLTGLALLRTDKEYIYIDYTDVIASNLKEDHFHRADNFISSLEKFKQVLSKYNGYKILCIERCFYGMGNPEVLIHLSHFGILAYATLKKEFDSWHYIGATTARSLIGFNQKKQEQNGTVKPTYYTRDTKDAKGKLKHKKGEAKKIDCKSLVHDYLKTDFGVEFESKDIADGWVLSMSGLLL
jgi:Holliday junction resolvasome RuvABC endonuclease subunit